MFQRISWKPTAQTIPRRRLCWAMQRLFSSKELLISSLQKTLLNISPPMRFSFAICITTFAPAVESSSQRRTHSLSTLSFRADTIGFAAIALGAAGIRPTFAFTRHALCGENFSLLDFIRNNGLAATIFPIDFSPTILDVFG